MMLVQIGRDQVSKYVQQQVALITSHHVDKLSLARLKFKFDPAHAESCKVHASAGDH